MALANIGSVSSHRFFSEDSNLNFLIAGTPNPSYSVDGITWATLPPNPALWTAATYGSGKYYVFKDGDVWSSSTGFSWSQISLPVSNLWRKSIFAGGKFVTVSEGVTTSESISSSDGITWTTGNLLSGAWLGLAYGNSTYIAAKYNTGPGDIYNISTSPDGHTWTRRSTLPPRRGWGAIAFGSGRFVMADRGDGTGVGSNSFAYSTNGLSWTIGTLPVTAVWTNITFADNKFVIISESTDIVYSPDGLSWSSTTVSAPPSAVWQQLEYGSGKFVIASVTATTYSTDAITWNTPTVLPNTNSNALVSAG